MTARHAHTKQREGTRPQSGFVLLTPGVMCMLCFGVQFSTNPPLRPFLFARPMLQKSSPRVADLAMLSTP